MYSERFLEGGRLGRNRRGIVTTVRREGGLVFECEASGRACSAHTGEIVIRPMRSLMVVRGL